MRIGTKQRPFYRVVLIDERSKRNGAYIELLGTYNPLTEPKEIKLKQDRIDHWTKMGAQMSDGFLRIIGKAPQRKPRKPKKASKQGTVDSTQLKTEEKIATEEPKTEEVPAEALVEETKVEETVQKDSENSEKPEDLKIGESDNQTEEVSKPSETPIPSDSSGTPSPSEFSEKTESKS